MGIAYVDVSVEASVMTGTVAVLLLLGRFFGGDNGCGSVGVLARSVSFGCGIQLHGLITAVAPVVGTGYGSVWPFAAVKS